MGIAQFARLVPLHFIRPVRCAAAAASALAFATCAHAQTNFTGGAGFTIPDGTATANGFISSTINVASSAQIAAFNSVTLTNLNHTWAGDVFAFLVHNNRAVQLIGWGEDDSSNFGGTYTLVASGTTNTLAAQATAGGTAYVIPTGTYLPYDGSFADFVGQDVAGAWTLQVFDTAAGDTGSLGNWSFNATVNNPTPPPATATYSGAGAAIPDATFTAPGVVASDIVVTDTFTIDSLSSVTITGLFHDYVGDLTAQLIHVDTGTTVDLFAQLGRTTTDAADLGDDSNFGGTYTFTPSGPSLLAAAQNGNTSFVLPNSPFAGGVGTYAASTSGVPGAANPNTLASFNGETVAGTWRLRLTDSNAGDAGSFSGWRFGATAASSAVAPEPGSLPLALAAFPLGFALVRRRRAL